MSVVGLLVIGYGIPLVRMEIGWTAVIGGAVVASAGCIVLVLGVFLVRLEQMQATLDRLLPVAIPDDLAYGAPAAADPFDQPSPAKPLHPLSPAARIQEPEDDTVQPEPFLTAAAEPALEFASPVRPALDWTADPARMAEPVLVESAPALVYAEEEASHPPAVEAPDRVADPVAETPLARARPSFLSSLLPRRGSAERAVAASGERFRRPRDLVAPAAERPALRDLPVDLSSGWDEARTHSVTRDTAPERDDVEAPPETRVSTEAEPPPQPPDEALAHPEAAPEPAMAELREPERPADDLAASTASAPAAIPLPAPDPLQPIVVGRYNAGSASYVMFSNGMIQVETEQGTHEFASMQDLKVFIERRDARAS